MYSSPFITDLYSQPFPHCERYDRIRVDVLVDNISEKYHSMIFESDLYLLLQDLKGYHDSLLLERDKSIFLAEISRRGFDISDEAIQQAENDANESVNDAYQALYGEAEAGTRDYWD